MTTRKSPTDLRSHRWLGVDDLRAFGHRSRLRQMGYEVPSTDLVYYLNDRG